MKKFYKIALILYSFIFNFVFAQEQNKIKVVSCHNPPYYFYENSKFHGAEVELLDIIFSYMNLDYQYYISECAEAIQKTEIGYYNILLHNNTDNYNKNNLLDSEQLFKMNLVFFRKKYDYSQNYSQKIRVGVPPGYSDKNLSQNKNFEVTHVLGNNNYLNALLKVYFNEIDYFICDKITCEYVIEKYKKKFPELNTIERKDVELTNSLSIKASFSLVNSLNKNKFREFNKVLKQIKKTYLYKAILIKYNIRNY